MAIDDRDYMRKHGRAKDWSMGTRVDGRSSNAPGEWLTKFLVWLVVALVFFAIFKQFDNRLSRRPERASANTVFPPTGEVRWFVASKNAPGNFAPLSITGAHDAGKNTIVRLDNWDTRAPVAMIPIRGGETAHIEMPLGRYRMMYSTNAAWYGEAELFGDVREAVEPLQFYRVGARVKGHTIDLNSRLNGNLQTKPAGFVLGAK